jgi:hypothetical protein
MLSPKLKAEWNFGGENEKPLDNNFRRTTVPANLANFRASAATF